MIETKTSRESRAVILFTRVDPVFKQEVKRVADRDFDGNESQLVRDSVRLMLGLRNELGPRFDLVVAGLLNNRSGGSPQP
ncbi:MAG: hypothetical protein IT335_13005 [Thermomicrobiales bacterium]|nr:hypothetical protein [Thermomicrobiales bacterium]